MNPIRSIGDVLFRVRRVRVAVVSALTLVVFGASAQADVFKIEIDYMVGDHSHMPNATVIDAVVQMFACQGHTLVIEVSDLITHYNVLRRDPNDCEASLFDYSGSADTFGAIKNSFFDHSEADGWHYCLFAHQFEDDECATSGSSGLGERPGWNFVVTLGSWMPDQTGSDFDQAATLAHEFGHNLGLGHCGPADCDDVGNYSPILPSVMSYRYQLQGVRTNLLCKGLAIPEALFKEINYSHGRMCSMDETNLDEPFGTVMTKVDWNCDGDFDTGVVQDINGGSDGWCGDTANYDLMDDLDEWSVISDPEDAGMAPPEQVSCITWAEWQNAEREMGPRGGGCGQPALSVESCLAGENVYVGPETLYSDYSCDHPVWYVDWAHQLAPADSVFFVLPGTYEETVLFGTLVLDTPGTWFCNIGTAVIK